MTKSERLPNAKDWRKRDVKDWNCTTFTEYLKDKHRELFRIDYVPFGGTWRTEQGMLGRLIGTRAKAGTHDKAIIKRFIDETFESYKPTPQYPGTNFGFMYSYRKYDLQRIEAEEKRRQASQAKAEEQGEIDYEELADWL